MMYRRKDTVPMTVTLGILALLEARAGKGDELAAFLKAGRDLAVAEEGTVTWYAFKISDTSYGIFDTFATGDARTAHINGQIPAAEYGPDRRYTRCPTDHVRVPPAAPCRA